jgi:UDP-GlcNAc:undecaprenyl-phosphate GlcNAc-1-phosphate transferase
MGGAAILVMGFVDDVRCLRARWKLLVEMAVALFLYWWGIRIDLVGSWHTPPLPLYLAGLDLFLNMLWIIVAINAMNIIDGLDGLAGGVFAIGMVVMLPVSLAGGQVHLALISAALLGGAFAFLRFNLNNATIHLGDNGSLFLGYCLAVFVPLTSPQALGATAYLIPLGALSIPITEVVATSLRRIWQGKRLTRPDRGHAHHRLVREGMTPKRVAFFIQVISLLCVLAALAATYAHSKQVAMVAFGIWAALMVLFVKVGYFRRLHPKLGKNPAKSPIFLDHNRLIQRLLWKISKAKDVDDYEGYLSQFCHCLNLAHIECVFKHPISGIELSLSSKSRQPDDVAPELSLKIPINTEGGLKGDLVCLTPYDTDKKYWPMLLIWIHKLSTTIGKSIDARKDLFDQNSEDARAASTGHFR